MNTNASTIREAPHARTVAPTAPRRMNILAPTFFRGLLVAVPLTTALWIAIFFMVRAEL